MSIARRLILFCIFGLASVLLHCIPGHAAVPIYSFTTLATFNGANGSEPEAGLVADTAGNLYGTTTHGGASDAGTVFQIAAGTHALSTLVTFNGANGSVPIGGLVADANGNLFGAAYRGGTNNHGTIFELASGTHNLSTLAMINDINSDGPLSPLTFDSSGNLYGSTYVGGQYGYRVVFQLAATTHALNTVASFNFPTTGAYPLGGVLVDASGNLFGTANYGGDLSQNNGSGAGSVFKIAAGTQTITTLATFNNTNGSFPESSLVADQFGNLYGTTSFGASGYGTVFELPKASSTITAIVTFTSGTNGIDPESAGLCIDANGNLFGTTSIGGAYGNGTVFEVAAGTHAFSTIFSFNGANGSNSYGTL